MDMVFNTEEAELEKILSSLSLFPRKTWFGGKNAHLGSNDPHEQPLASSRRQVHSDGAETGRVIFKNKLTKSVPLKKKKSWVLAELSGEAE